MGEGGLDAFKGISFQSLFVRVFRVDLLGNMGMERALIAGVSPPTAQKESCLSPVS